MSIFNDLQKHHFSRIILKITILILILFHFKISTAQSRIQGVILNSKTNLPLAYVNVGILGTTKGTVTNAEGIFSIIVSESDRIMLKVSHLGYCDTTIALELSVKKSLSIAMREKTYSLAEVIIMPDNTIYNLLKKAYRKIPENYPVTPTRYEGFYRETLKSESGNYLAFGEATIEAVKGSVKMPNDNGQIKILTSRGGYFPGRDSVTSVHVYAALFSATSNFVQRHVHFIDPENKTYDYFIEKTDNQYKVFFRNIIDTIHGYKGYFLIDTLTYAYTEASWSVPENAGANPLIKRLDSEGINKFIKIGSKYYLNYSKTNWSGFDRSKQKKIVHSYEYLSTGIYPDTERNIPDSEQLNYYDDFIFRVQEKNDDFWQTETIFEADTNLKKQMQFSLTAEQMKAISHNKQNSKIKNIVLSTLLYKTSFLTGFTVKETPSLKGSYICSIPSLNQSFDKELSNTNAYFFSGGIMLELSKNIYGTFDFSNAISKQLVYNDVLIGIGAQKKLNRFGKSNLLALSLKIGHAKTNNLMGSFQNSNTFNWGNKKLDSKSIAVYSGNNSLIIKPEISFVRHLRGLFSIYLSAAYQYQIAGEEIVVLKEKSVIFRKSAIEDANNNSNTMLKDGQPIENLAIRRDGFSFTIGLKTK